MSPNTQDIERLPLGQFTESAYLNYSMYVIMDRALPFIGDGLKPVQRRIIYAMSELGLNASAKFKKSARTVGDVLGKYHPHGDSACYEAMVLMAQPFSYRYPLIDGQGNWGAPDDPKSFAAMRYTESRLSSYSALLLGELGQGTADYVANFDGTLEEPKALPARLPNILLNGTTGIAVGMATDIPPHNLQEIAQAIILLLDKPHASLDDVLNHILGPDFPTEAEIITPRDEIYKIYQTGKGAVRTRAIWIQEDNEIVITALPYQVSGAKILEQIAQQMRAKKLPFIEDLRDESDHKNPTRLIIVPRATNPADAKQLMNHLFATTDLEKSYRINMNVIGLDHRPMVKDLLTILHEWLTFRRLTVKKRLSHRLDKVSKRLHILQGLLKAYLNLDEVIDLIRSEDEPKLLLMKKFALTEIQAEAILELRLRHLAKLEEIKIRTEQHELSKEQKTLEAILASKLKLNALIKQEVIADNVTYGDKRRAILVQREDSKAFDEQDLTPVEPISVILSQMGWARVVKGHDVDPVSLNYRSGDQFLAIAKGTSNSPAVFLDSAGRSYVIDPRSLPPSSAKNQGEPVTGKITLPPNAQVVQVLMGETQQKWLFASDAGYGFICLFDDLLTRNRGGKAVVTLSEHNHLLPPKLIQEGNDNLLAVTQQGRLLIFPLEQLPQLSKGKGNKMINIPSQNYKNSEDRLRFIELINADSTVILFAGKRKLTLEPRDLYDFYSERGRRGSLLPRGLQHVERIVVK